MSVDQMKISAAELNYSLIYRFLGALCLLGAPMLLIQFSLNQGGPTQLTAMGRLVAFLGVLYMGGWLAGAFGMRRLRVTGNGTGSRIVFWIQAAGLFLATTFSVLETLGYNQDNGGVIFLITDLAYPFSHLFMNVVAIMTIRAGVWHGLPKFAPLLVGLALPLTILFAGLAGMAIAASLFGLLTTVGLGVIGYTIIKQS